MGWLNHWALYSDSAKSLLFDKITQPIFKTSLYKWLYSELKWVNSLGLTNIIFNDYNPHESYSLIIFYIDS